MMKSMIAGVVAVAGLAAGANAAWGLRFEVWNGAAWVSSINANNGDVVKFRFGAYFDANSAPVITTADGTGTAQALARFTGSNQAVGFGGTDNFQNVVRTITSGNPALVTITGATIGTSAVTSFGSQLFLADVPFETYKEIYIGEVKLDAAGLNRVITLQNKTFGSGSAAGLTFYNNASLVNKQSGAPQAGGPARVDQTATITVVPAPASLALVGLGGLVAARRRRA